MSMYEQGYPYPITVGAGKSVYICRCGHTNNPPYCDGSHQAHPPAQPFEYKAEEETTIYACGCSKSNNLPFCDGSHNDPS